MTTAALAALLMLATGAATIQASAAAAARPATTMHMLVTLYGWLDNSRPGAGIAYPVIHRPAGGVGTWQNPVTFATSKAEFKPGTRLYVPALKRYFVMEGRLRRVRPLEMSPKGVVAEPASGRVLRWEGWTAAVRYDPWGHRDGAISC